MKTLIFSVLILLATKALSFESGPGNGTDYVKILFAEAQYKILAATSAVTDEDVRNLEIKTEFREWLLEKQEGKTRWSGLKKYLRTMELRYQQEPCTDFTKKPASICYFMDAQNEPYVVVSLKENKMTSRQQAMAMLIHEAGHFTGEKNHEFLDQVGVQLVAALEAPSILILDEETTEIVPVPQFAKEECDKGTSSQAEQLKKKLLMNLKVQCQSKRLSCNLRSTEFVFKGTVNFKEGVGFDMTVTCQARAVLILR